MFAFIGVEIVVIAAGEAKHPRRDLPMAIRWLYLFAITVYVSLMVLASLNVPYDDRDLLQYAQTSSSNNNALDDGLTTGNRSPFIIALKRAGFEGALPGLLNAVLFFAAVTAA